MIDTREVHQPPPKSEPVSRPVGDEPRPVRSAVDGLKKSYGKREAVKGVSFALTDGVTGLLGRPAS